MRRSSFFLIVYLLFCIISESCAENVSTGSSESLGVNNQLITHIYKLPLNTYGQLNLLLRQEKFINIYAKYNLKFHSSALTLEKTYYDTKDFKLLNQDNSLYFLDVIQNDSSNIARFSIDKHIIFFSKKNFFNYELRRKNKVISPEDKHPLLGKIKREQRKVLIQQLNNSGIEDIFAFKKILSAKIYTLTHYLFYEEQPIVQLSLEFNTAKALAGETNYLELVFKSYPTFDHKLPPDINQLIPDVLSFFEKNTQQEIKEEVLSSYNKAFYLLSRTNYFLDFFVMYPLAFKLLQVIFYSVVGSLFLYLFLNNRQRSQ